MRAAVLVLVAAACGDNAYPVGAPLARSADVTIVAHQDDDLLFMQPDLFEAVQAGTGITNVYVTAGNARGGILLAEQRQHGLMRAYAGIAGSADSADWFCGTLALAGHTALHCRLDAGQVSLVFLGYPDGGKQGEESDSLTRLWNGDVERTTTIARDVTTYDRAGLIAAVAAVLDETRPALVRTLEVASTHGRDHADHLIAGALAVAATAASRVHPALIAYRGYNTELEPANVIEPLYARSAEILARYRGCPGDCIPISDAHDTWLHRRYAVAMRPLAAGTLRPVLGDGCVVVDHIGGLALGDCATAPTWSLATDGTLHVAAAGTTSDRCLALQAGQLITTSTCTATTERRFFLDDDGHLFAGAPPGFGASAAQHLQCLVVDGGRPRAGTCGGDSATTWVLAAVPTATPRPAGLTRSGRAVRLADLDGDRRADLCAIETGNLACASGDGAGGFAAMTSIGALAVEPESLVIGDVDGDTLPDACGRDAGGISCALAATGFVAARWSAAFASAGPSAATDRSLAAADANGDGSSEICGLAADGVVCAYPGLAAVPAVRSPWPARDAVLWPGDLDGDGRADWCTATASGVACGVDAHRELTTDGVPWSFALAGLVDPSPATITTGALADIDGDGLADLCSLRDRTIVCARSQGRGFGPATIFGTLPAGAQPTALWLGDLDGNGTADACVEDATTIRCVR